MNFIKLLTFEMNRFMKLYVALICITIISQIAGTIIISRVYLKSANREIIEYGMSQATYIQEYGPINFMHIISSLWFYGPIALGVVGLILYVFLIWYRDWFGKNTFIYRLLMLPTSRLNVYLSKATAIMLLVLGLVTVQLILLPATNTIFKWIIPAGLRVDLTIREVIKSDYYLSIIIPESFPHFILNYGIGVLFLIAVFTVIMLERSFHLKGILLGIIYISFIGLFITAPTIIQWILDKFYLYPEEMLILDIGLVSIVIAGSIWLSKYLLKNKITV